MSILTERWRVVVANERVKSEGWSNQPYDPDAEAMRNAVEALPDFAASVKIVTESGIVVLQRAFKMPYAKTLHHITDLHNASLGGAA